MSVRAIMSNCDQSASASGCTFLKAALAALFSSERGHMRASRNLYRPLVVPTDGTLQVPQLECSTLSTAVSS